MRACVLRSQSHSWRCGRAHQCHQHGGRARSPTMRFIGKADMRDCFVCARAAFQSTPAQPGPPPHFYRDPSSSNPPRSTSRRGHCHSWQHASALQWTLTAIQGFKVQSRVSPNHRGGVLAVEPQHLPHRVVEDEQRVGPGGDYLGIPCCWARLFHRLCRRKCKPEHQHHQAWYKSDLLRPAEPLPLSHAGCSHAAHEALSLH